MVAGNRPVLRHFADPRRDDVEAHVAQQAEHFLGKEEVSGSNPDVGSTLAGAPG